MTIKDTLFNKIKAGSFYVLSVDIARYLLGHLVIIVKNVLRKPNSKK